MAVALSEKITQILNGTIVSVKTIIPFEMEISRPSLFTRPFMQNSLGVLIGITGDLPGRVLITGDDEIFSNIGKKMYGFQLDGDMLLSFSGELGNMIVGHLSTLLADWGYNMEITPPTVLVGQTEIHGFDKGFQLPVHIKEIGDIQILLMLETL